MENAPEPEGAPAEIKDQHTDAARAEAARLAAERAAAEQAAAKQADDEQAAKAQTAIAALDAALAARAAPPAGDPEKQSKEKWPDYLIQWRNGLWVSIREKESNVWKFVAFYASAITLIIGLGQKVLNTADPAKAVSPSDLALDVSAIGAVVGLLTFWGLAIVIDSNFWLSRNLKLVGNIEKIFIPENEYDRIIPKTYASPCFRYARPYTVDFFFLVVLGIIAYLNFLLHFPDDDQNWRYYLLPSLSVLYVFGFFMIQWLDHDARRDYFDNLYRHAKGKPLAIGSETMPTEHLEFQVATSAKFQLWAVLGAAFILVSTALREVIVGRRTWPWWFVAAGVLAGLVYAVLSRLLSRALKSKERDKNAEIKGGRLASPVKWDDLRSESLAFGLSYERAGTLHKVVTATCRWGILLAVILLLCFANWPGIKAALHLTAP